jgi:hypothetical protein
MKPQPITPDKVDELLRFLPRFESPGRPFVVRWGGGETTEDGAVTMPYPVYADDVQDFFRLAGQECWLDAQYLTADPAKMLADDDAVEAATMEQVRAMLTYCVRAERFGDGNWDAFLRSGRISALLRRLKALRSGMKEPEPPSPSSAAPAVANRGAEESDGFDARLRAALEKAWWKDMTSLVGSTDRQLVVIAPRSETMSAHPSRPARGPRDARSAPRAIRAGRVGLCRRRHGCRGGRPGSPRSTARLARHSGLVRLP